jgi:hypothetical protein
MDALIYILAYLISGAIYVYIKYLLDILPDMWSPAHPLFMIILWPIVLTSDLIRKINNEIKNLKSS